MVDVNVELKTGQPVTVTPTTRASAITTIGRASVSPVISKIQGATISATQKQVSVEIGVGQTRDNYLSILKDVLLTDLLDNQLLKYNSASGKWLNWTPNFLTSFTESDPVFNAWLVATPPIYSESDPVFSAWDKSYNDITDTPDLSVYVPYTGAMNDVDLGTKNFLASTITGTIASISPPFVSSNVMLVSGSCSPPLLLTRFYYIGIYEAQPEYYDGSGFYIWKSSDSFWYISDLPEHTANCWKGTALQGDYTGQGANEGTVTVTQSSSTLWDNAYTKSIWNTGEICGANNESQRFLYGVVLGRDAPTGSANTAGILKFYSAGDNAFYSTFTAPTQTANADYTLPTALPVGNNYPLISSTAGVLGWNDQALLTTSSPIHANLNISAKTLGSELITSCGDMSCSTGWILAPDYECGIWIADGVMHFNYDGCDGADVAARNLNGLVSVNHYYEISYTVKNYVSDGIKPSLGGWTGTTRSANGRYTEQFKIVSSTGFWYVLLFTPTSDATVLDIDDVSIKEILTGVTETPTIFTNNFITKYPIQTGDITIGFGASYRVTGVLTPDISGDYIKITTSENPTYQRSDGAYYIWYEIDTFFWYISDTVGQKTTNYWKSSSGIGGTYDPYGGAVGTPTITTGVNPTLIFNGENSVGLFTWLQNISTLKLGSLGSGLWLDGTQGSTPTSGSGTRLMWIPAKHSFRAGKVSGTQWDDANIADYSFAQGYNVTASASYNWSFGRSFSSSVADSFNLGWGQLDYEFKATTADFKDSSITATDILPTTDDTYYLGQIGSPFKAYKAVILKDTINGKHYKITTASGIVVATALD